MKKISGLHFYWKMSSGKWYKFIIPRNIICDWVTDMYGHKFKLVRWLWFIWRVD